jgi:hypothetical protein
MYDTWDSMFLGTWDACSFGGAIPTLSETVNFGDGHKSKSVFVPFRYKTPESPRHPPQPVQLLKFSFQQLLKYFSFLAKDVPCCATPIPVKMPATRATYSRRFSSDMDTPSQSDDSMTVLKSIHNKKHDIIRVRVNLATQYVDYKWVPNTLLIPVAAEARVRDLIAVALQQANLDLAGLGDKDKTSIGKSVLMTTGKDAAILNNREPVGDILHLTQANEFSLKPAVRLIPQFCPAR